MEPAENDGNGGTRALMIVAGLALIASVSAGVFFFSAGDSASGVSPSGFDLSGVDAQVSAAAGVRDPIRASPRPLIGDDSPPDAPPPLAAAAGTSQAGYTPRAPGQAPAADEPTPTPRAVRLREKEFLKAHGREIARYHGKLHDITRRYHKNAPVVREVDQAFGRMSRYMAVKQRFDKDRDPYQFARDSIALPEVRAQIAKCMTDHRVWLAAFGMVSEALKQPPPPALYGEAKKFMTNDPAVSEYVGEFTGKVAENVPAMVKGIPPGMSLDPLRKVVGDIAPNAPLPPR